MLHEPASSPDHTPRSSADLLLEPEEPTEGDRLTQLVGQFMQIEDTFEPTRADLQTEDAALMAQHKSQPVISYVGALLQPADRAYEQLDQQLAPADQWALFRQQVQQTPHGDTHTRHVIHILSRRPTRPGSLSWWPNLLLFLATVVSVLLTGALIAIGEISLEDAALGEALAQNLWRELWRGIPYAASILLILGSHEMAHYVMMRRHNVPGSLPYFIPAFLLSPFGTFGAAIVLRGPLRSRRALLDIGASGPIAGMVFAVPILLIGLATSIVTASPPGGLVEGNSLLYAAAKIVALGEFLPAGGRDVLLNQFAWAGWTGLFVTALNLLPLGQLDGGHVLYSLLGDRARRLYTPLLVFMGLLTLLLSSVWLVFVLLLFLVGRHYAVPLDNITPLDRTRRRVAIGVLVMLVLVFTPVPLYISGQPGGLLGGLLNVETGTLLVAMLVTLPRLLRRRLAP